MTNKPFVFRFPICGIDVSGSIESQSPKPLPEGQDDDGAKYGRTCAVGVNVRTMEATTLRRTGGSRPGTVKYIPQRVGGFNWAVQEIAGIVTTSASALP